MSKRRIQRKVTPYLLIAPAAVLLLVFVYGVVNGVLQGFGIMPFIGRTEFTLEYYREALSRPDLVSSILYSLYLATVSSIIATVGGVALSAALTRLGTRESLRILGVQLPIMTSHSVVVLFVLVMLASSGMVARVLFNMGLIDDMQQFPTVLGASSGWGIILVYLWKEIPFIAFSTVTIMGNISGRYSEAAACMGASPLRTFFFVTLPLCKGAIAKAFLIVFAFVLGSYEVPFLLGATTSKALPVLAYTEYLKPDILDRCSAQALNGIVALIALVLAIVYFAIVVRERKGGAENGEGGDA